MKKYLFLALAFSFLSACLPLTASASTQILMGQTLFTPPASDFWMVPGEFSQSTQGGVTFSTTTAVVSPADGTLSSLYGYTDFAPTGSYTIALTVNGTDTALSCTISSAGTKCSDLTHSIAIHIGDSFAIHESHTGTARHTKFSIAFTPTIANSTMISGNTNNAFLSSSLTTYEQFYKYAGALTTPANTQVFADAGVVDNMGVYTTSALAQGSYAFSLEKNSIAGSNISCAIDTTVSFCQDLSNATTTAVGDYLNIKDVPTGTPTSRAFSFSVRFTPATPGRFELLTAANNIFSGTVIQYNPVVGFGPIGIPTATEASTTLFAQPMIVHSMIVRTAANVGGSGASAVFTFRVNSADTALTCSIPSGQNSCTITTDVVVGQDAAIDIKHNSTGTPGNIMASIGLSASPFINPVPPPAVGAKHTIIGGMIKIIGGFFRFK